MIDSERTRPRKRAAATFSAEREREREREGGGKSEREGSGDDRERERQRETERDRERQRETEPEGNRLGGGGEPPSAHRPQKHVASSIASRTGATAVSYATRPWPSRRSTSVGNARAIQRTDSASSLATSQCHAVDQVEELDAAELDADGSPPPPTPAPVPLRPPPSSRALSATSTHSCCEIAGGGAA